MQTCCGQSNNEDKEMQYGDSKQLHLRTHLTTSEQYSRKWEFLHENICIAIIWYYEHVSAEIWGILRLFWSVPRFVEKLPVSLPCVCKGTMCVRLPHILTQDTSWPVSCKLLDSSWRVDELETVRHIAAFTLLCSLASRLKSTRLWRDCASNKRIHFLSGLKCLLTLSPPPTSSSLRQPVSTPVSHQLILLDWVSAAEWHHPVDVQELPNTDVTHYATVGNWKPVWFEVYSTLFILESNK